MEWRSPALMRVAGSSPRPPKPTGADPLVNQNIQRLKQRFGNRSPWEWVGGYVLVAWAVVEVADTMASLIGFPLWFGKAILLVLGVGLVVVISTAAVQHSAGWGEASGGTRRLRRLFTWRNTVVAGVAGMALLGLVTAGHLAARSLGLGPVGTLLTRGVLEAPDLVLADFEDHTGDDDLGRALTQAFRVHLSQSPTVRLASPARVQGALTRMEAEPGPFGLERAREVAIREGMKAVVAGEIHGLGSRYSVSAVVVAAESGDELVTALETADDAGDLIGAVERLSLRLRERIGESLASVRQSPPLSRVRTASLAALKSYTEAADANSRGDFERCALLSDEAIALDSLSAMAYVGRAACNQNLGRNSALQVADRVRAYRMRERMTEQERLRFTAVYHQFVTGDRVRAVDAWEAYSARFPESSAARFALANLYAEGRDWTRAEEALERGLELDPSSVIVLVNLAGYQANQGRFHDAGATLDRLAEALPELDLSWWRAGLYLATADWPAAEAEVEVAQESARGDPARWARTLTLGALMSWTRGRIDAAERSLREAIAADTAAGDIESFHARSAVLASLLLHARGDTVAAVRTVENALAAHPLESLEPLNRSYFPLADVLAQAGQLGAPRRLIDGWAAEAQPLIPGAAVPAWLRARLAGVRGQLDDALLEWRMEDQDREDPILVLAEIGQLHDRAGRPDSAIAYYERYLTTPSRLRYNSDPIWRGHVLERLADLLEQRGDTAESARHRAALVELWTDADPVLQPRVTRARQWLEAWTAES